MVLPASDSKDGDRAAGRFGLRVVTIRYPTEEETDRIRRFTVHEHYLTSIDLYLGVLYGYGAERTERLVREQRSLPGYRRIQRRPMTDERELRRLLAISWASEIQLRVSAIGGDAFLRYSNAWAAVHAYYAVYMSIHAWLGVTGSAGTLDDHTSTLRTVVAQLVQRRLVPHPWDISCTGHPALREREIHGVPAGAAVDEHFETLATPAMETFYPRFAKMLETTRSERLKRNGREWLRQNGRKNIRAAEKRALSARLAPTTLFDYLWRLRVRSNYRDVSTFLVSGLDDRSHASFHRGRLAVAESTCLLIQSLIVAYVGAGAYRDAIDEFMAGGGVGLGDPAGFLVARRDAIAPAPPATGTRTR